MLLEIIRYVHRKIWRKNSKIGDELSLFLRVTKQKDKTIWRRREARDNYC